MRAVKPTIDTWPAFLRPTHTVATFGFGTNLTIQTLFASAYPPVTVTFSVILTPWIQTYGISGIFVPTFLR